jgi:hypothetical protein
LGYRGLQLDAIDPRCNFALAAGADRRWEYGPAGNYFGVGETPGGPGLDLSNGGTDVLFDVLTLAGCIWPAPRGSST